MVAPQHAPHSTTAPFITAISLLQRQPPQPEPTTNRRRRKWWGRGTVCIPQHAVTAEMPIPCRRRESTFRRPLMPAEGEPGGGLRQATLQRRMVRVDIQQSSGTYAWFAGPPAEFYDGPKLVRQLSPQ
eukprot:gene13010-biopygen1538